MKKTWLFVIALIYTSQLVGAELVERPPVNMNTKTKEELEAERVLNEFLLEYDEGVIKKDYKAAVKQNSLLKRIDTDLPPRTPDLFASGLFMPYEDDQQIYHDFDRIYFKVKDGNWNLDKKSETAVKSGIVFTKEYGYENEGSK